MIISVRSCTYTKKTKTGEDLKKRTTRHASGPGIANFGAGSLDGGIAAKWCSGRRRAAGKVGGNGDRHSKGGSLSHFTVNVRRSCTGGQEKHNEDTMM